jgi:6-phosphogluconolactonase
LIERRSFAGSEDLAAALAEAVAADLDKAIGEHGHASLAVSGGSTPKLFFEALSRHVLPWDRVFATLVDERWVPDTDARSNAALVKSRLLKNHAAGARFVPLYTGHATPEDGLPAAEAALGEIPLPLDVAILGMGNDGHTASFFPGGDNLAAALSDASGLAVAMRAPGAGEPRITLTRKALLQAGALYLHIEGAEKSAVFDRAMAPGAVDDMPVRAMLHQDQADLVIYSAP